MPTIDITTTATVRAGADHVWTILAVDFLDAGRWVGSIDHVDANPSAPPVPGAPAGGRACTIQGFGVTDERITTFDETDHVLEYTLAAAKVPGFVHDMRNLWVVRSTGPQTCEVTSRINAHAAGLPGALVAPMLRRKLRATARDVMADLVTYAETGTPRRSKQATTTGT